MARAQQAPANVIRHNLQVEWRFHTKIAGVSHRNRNGTSRQKIIARCKVGEPVLFVPEPSNPYDPNAIALFRQNGEQLGYLGADLAERIAMSGPHVSELVGQITHPRRYWKQARARREHRCGTDDRQAPDG
jgi:hypothetical protein